MRISDTSKLAQLIIIQDDATNQCLVAGINVRVEFHVHSSANSAFDNIISAAKELGFVRREWDACRCGGSWSNDNGAVIVYDDAMPHSPSPSETADNADRQAESEYSHSDGAHAPEEFDD